MRTQIDTPFRDAAASDLRLVLGDAPGAPLAVLPVTFGTVTLNLRVLDASHSVQLDADTTQICEIVGVLPETSAPSCHASSAASCPARSTRSRRSPDRTTSPPSSATSTP